MRQVIYWAKSNLLVVIAAVAVFGSLGWVYIIRSQGASFREEMQSSEKPIRAVSSLRRSSVEIPSANPNVQSETIEICITRAAIEKYKQMQGHLNQEYGDIFKWVVDRNQLAGPYTHMPMTDGLFPGPSEATSLPYDAMADYLRILAQFTDPAEADGSYPRLNAGRPLTKSYVQEQLDLFDLSYREMNLLPAAGAGMLKEDDAAQLRQKKYERLIKLLQDHARGIHMYASTPASGPGQFGKLEPPEDTPFFIGPWARKNTKPTSEELWEGQLDLWIQQDIVYAIAITNQVDNPDLSVMDAPIKRLVSININPGYVGVNSQGSVIGYVGAFQGKGQANRGPRSLGVRGGVAPGMPGRGRFPGEEDDFGFEDEDEDSFDSDGEEETQDNFTFSPTGRRTTSLYDVRHATVALIIDSTYIPGFLDTLSRINFMTVLMLAVNDVDEYEHLRGEEISGGGGAGGSDAAMYVYGPHDAVHLELVLETLWLRRWTAGHQDDDEAQRLDEPFDPGLMPDSARRLLKLKPREPGGDAEDDDEEEQEEAEFEDE